MSTPLTLTFGFDRRLFARALMAFWTSAVPAPSFRYRVAFWVIAWTATLFAVLAMAGLGWPWAVIWGVVAAGFGVGVIILQRVRMARFYDALAAHWTRTGDMAASFDETGLSLTQTGAAMRFDWAAVDAVVRARGGTVLRIGMTMIAIPDAALPEGLTPDGFRQRLNLWRDA